MDEHIYPSEPQFFAEVEANRRRGNRNSNTPTPNIPYA